MAQSYCRAQSVQPAACSPNSAKKMKHKREHATKSLIFIGVMSVLVGELVFVNPNDFF